MISDCPTLWVGKIRILIFFMWAPKGRAARGFGGILPQKSLKSWSSEMPFASFLRAKLLSKKLTKLIVIFMQNFYLRGFLYEYLILFIFVRFLKFLVYPFSLRILWYVFLYEYHTNHFKIFEQISKLGFFLSRLHNMVGIWDIQAKLG